MISLAAFTTTAAEMPNMSSSSSHLPERGTPDTARWRTIMFFSMATADFTASPMPPAATIVRRSDQPDYFFHLKISISKYYTWKFYIHLIYINPIHSVTPYFLHFFLQMLVSILSPFFSHHYINIYTSHSMSSHTTKIYLFYIPSCYPSKGR